MTMPNGNQKHLHIKLLSPSKILSLSHGEVKNHFTLNAITQLPEPGGLFDCKIFGPVEDYTCICGKIRRDKSKKGQTCPQCGVEITTSFARRRRMGHITLAAPVVHVWYHSIIATLLGIPPKKLEKVIYYESFIVMDSDDESFKIGDIIDYQSYINHRDKVKALTGGAAIQTLLKKLDLWQLYDSLKKETPSRRINKRLQVVREFINSDSRPEYMVMDIIPVLPPDLRPVLHLSDGTVASSDLNDLYAMVIIRNNRLKRFIRLHAPDIILNAERRLLQISVDCLFDNGRKYTAKNSSGKKVLKSLTETISTKEGRLRQNLLGKRVDYSGRSHIVVGPDLKLHQVGLPKIMALELFKPFVFNRLIQKGYASSIRHASVIVEQMLPEAIEALMEVVEEHPVILNRAPTLHKLSMQAFDPIIIEGQAIRLHPLVCSGFNADFDGDQMAVHVPLSLEAQIEARVLMLSVNNILHPANGKPSMLPSQDMVLGIYWLTKEKNGAKRRHLSI